MVTPWVGGIRSPWRQHPKSTIHDVRGGREVYEWLETLVAQKGDGRWVKSPVEKHHHVTGDFLVGNVVSGLSFFCSKKSQVGRHLHLPSWERSHTPLKRTFF